MKTPFPFVQTNGASPDAIGTLIPGSRTYVKTGPREKYTDWMNAILSVCEGRGFFTPGTVAEYVQVSRAAVHKRLKEGRLTAFQYNYTDAGGNADLGDKSFIYIPAIESVAWAEEMKIRRAKSKEKTNA